MSREHPAPTEGVLRVSGSATLTAPCDQATFVVTLSSSSSTVGRANAALRRKVARLDKVLISHPTAVSGAQHQPIEHTIGEQVVTASARIQLTGPNNAGLSDVLSALRRLDGSEVSAIKWSLSAENPVFEFVRRAATEDALASGRAHVRALGTQLLSLEWLTNDDPPVRLDANDVNAVVRSAVVAQFSIGAANLAGADTTGR